MEESLKNLREEIDKIDSELVELLARRRQIVNQVAEEKKSRGLPIYHPAREEDLISDRRLQALNKNLNPDMVEDLFRRVIRESRQSQESEFHEVSVRPGAKIVIIGGKGAMGQLFSRWFQRASYQVVMLEKEDWEEADEICHGANLALLCVPIGKTEAVAHFVAPHLPRDCVLADITSVKARPLNAMLESHPGPVVGIHPMFGPTTTSLDKQIVVICEGREPEQCQWIADQFAAWGAIILNATAPEHDQMMNIVQALRHFATFAFGQFLATEAIDVHRTLDFSSPIYRLELGMVGRLFAQDPDLYAEIIFATPERLGLLKKYLGSLQANLNLIIDGDKEAFKEEFRRISEWFGPFSDQAIRESSYLIEKLVERF